MSTFQQQGSESPSQPGTPKKGDTPDHGQGGSRPKDPNNDPDQTPNREVKNPPKADPAPEPAKQPYK